MQSQHAPRFVILGGSFNPVHAGHVALAEALVRLPGVTRLLAIPAARNPLKPDLALLPDALRLEMVRAALAHLPKASVLDLEMRRAPPSFSIDTVMTLRAQYPTAVLEWALGWDAFLDFPRWRRAKEFLAVAGLIIVPRAGVQPARASGAEEEGRACLEVLPRAWTENLLPIGPGQWGDKTGRTVLRWLPIRLPEVSASGILAERHFDLVPAPARVLLLDHLRIPSV